MTVESLPLRGAGEARRSTDAQPHLVDVTTYWSTAGGGVARYLRDKRRYAAMRAGWRHTWVVPGDCEAPDRSVGGIRIPLSGGYRFPLLRGRVAHLLARLQPDLIEVGDPFRLAWAGLDQEATLRQLFARYAALRAMSTWSDRAIGGLRLA